MSGIDSNTVLHFTLEVYITESKNRTEESDYTYAQEYKEEIQRVIEETRQHVSKWCLYPLRGFSTHFDKMANDLLNIGWFPFLNPSVCSKKIKKSQTKYTTGCVYSALKLSQFQMQLCIRYCTSTQLSTENINPHISNN